MHTLAAVCMCQCMEYCQRSIDVRHAWDRSVVNVSFTLATCPSYCRRDRVVRVLKLPTAPDDYAFMLSEDYARAVLQQQQLMQV